MTAEMMGPLRPSIFRGKLGNFEIITLLEGIAHREGPYPAFGGNKDQAEVEAFAREQKLPLGTFEHMFTPTMINTGEALVVFDTGFGAMMRGKGAGNMLQLVQQAGYKPEDVDVVVLTHGHPDHIAGIVEDGKPTYPNARYVFGEVEFDYWKNSDEVPENRIDNQKLFQKVVVPLAEKATFIKGGHDVVSGITSIEAFGHSPGHMCFHVESGGERLLIMGDTTTNYALSLPRPDWFFGLDQDKEKASETRKRILEMAASEKLWVTGYHMPFPAVGWIDRVGSDYRWVPHSYQLNL